jgi:capsular polysaccharide transport system permease protein
MKFIIRLFFFLLFAVSVVYIVFVETERYQSDSIALLKDLSKKQKVNMGAILLGQASETMQDSKVLELYIRSHEMFDYINKEFNLTAHYTGNDLDVLQRLYSDATLPFLRASKRNLLDKYNEDLLVVYDEPSGTLKLSFVHTDPKTARRILETILKRSEDIINQFSKENARVALAFIEKQKEEKRKEFIRSIRKLIAYQNAHHTIDPTLDVERKITILTDLETELVKNEVDYASKLKTWNPNGREMQMLRETIRNIKRSIERVKKELSGDGGKNELNANVFDFELLKSDMEFAKEVYRQTLIKEEEIKIEAAQKSKHLVIVAKPTLPDDYAYPNKPWDIFTVLIVLTFFYGIVISIISIVRNHRD